MKKSIATILICIGALLFCGLCTSCDKETNVSSNSSYDSLIVGKWEAINLTLFSEEGEVVDSMTNPDITMEFTSEGMLISTEFGDTDKTPYTIDGNYVFTNSVTYTIVELNNESLVLNSDNVEIKMKRIN